MTFEPLVRVLSSRDVSVMTIELGPIQTSSSRSIRDVLITTKGQSIMFRMPDVMFCATTPSSRGHSLLSQRHPE